MTVSRARRVRVVSTRTRPNSEMNVTPLVDVVLVLLIIFMVLSPLLEKDIAVHIPETEQVDDVSQVPPGQLLVSVTGAGDLQINSEKVSEASLRARLTQMLAVRPRGQRLVFFVADDKAPYALLVRALDEARHSGAETLAMLTEPP